ncbi:ATP-dependent DNA helicase chl1 [Coemansia sp. Benny D115]|nr:ATP-dependent DNA helicase chl1 [Coemansia sp. Benny D115]
MVRPSALDSDTSALPTPQTAEEFSFPMTPYSIQLDFMKRLFETLEHSKFAIFESPTGTGKSLSIICGAMTWLQHDRSRQSRLNSQVQTLPATVSSASEPLDWVAEYQRKQQIAQMNANATEGGAAEEKYNAWVVRTRRIEAAEMRSRKAPGSGAFRSSAKQNTKAEALTTIRTKRTAAEVGQTNKNESSDSELVVDAYYSDADADAGANSRQPDDLDDDSVHYSGAVRKLMARRKANKPLYDSDSDSDNDGHRDDEPPPEPSVTKLFYASRTHSQIQQFVSEIKRTRFATGSNRIKCVTLGSRAQLCVNDQVRNGCQSVHSLNERCLEMQQNSKMKRCGMLPLQHTPMLDYKEAVGRQIMDIEELATEGRKMSVCSYYGTRAAVNAAQVVALPYNMLLSRSARESMGLSLKGNVVIVDEAHNLVDTVLSIHSVSLESRVVTGLLEMMEKYYEKYCLRLKGSNVTYVRQTIALLKALSKFMARVLKDSGSKDSTTVASVNEFLKSAKADHINVYKIDKYLRESKIGRKLNMFVDRHKREALNDSGTKEPEPKRKQIDVARGNAGTDAISGLGVAPATAVAAFESFMACIGNPNSTGARMVVRALAAKGPSDTPNVELKYLLLDPSEPFGDICNEARAVVLAGGTMKPANDVVNQLLPTKQKSQDCSSEASLPSADNPMLDSANAQLFAWNHVVDPSHVCALFIGKGPTNQPLQFTFEDQSNPVRLREAGYALASLINVIPGGMVAFFPSYSLLNRMLAEWRSAGIVQSIERKKPLFTESSTAESGGNTENVLNSYTAQIRKPGSTGAVLLSVVGGRLSEGINFSDDLGRAVVMIGVPFPNLTSPELKERLAYYDSLGQQTGVCNTSSSSMGPRAREMYESLCMRAVNQSIGRAIRHRQDYAAIIFLDVRYTGRQIVSKLPEWILGSSDGRGQVAQGSLLAFGHAVAKVSSFFKSRTAAPLAVDAGK